MNLLLLSLYYHPDPAANAVIITALAQQLAARGHRVTVVCALPHYDRNAIWPAFRGKLLQREQLDGVDVRRVWLYVPPSKANLLGRLWNYITFNVMSSLAGLGGPKPDVILAPSPPLTIGLSAWLLGLLRRCPYVYNVQDIYPDVAVRLGVLTSRKVIAFFAAMERFVYRHARAVTVLSEGFRRNLLAKGVPNAKIVVIPNLVDTAALQPGVKDNPLARREGLGDRFVVLFAGNVGLSQGLEHVLESARLLQGVKGLLFLIVGNGAAKPGLEQEAARMELTNVRFLPFQPRADLADLYASADVCLVPLKHGIADESVPSKMLSISAAGRPLIASVDEPSDTAQHVRESGCGLVVPPEDPQALAAAIMALYRDPDRARRMGMLGRAHVETRFTPEVVGAAYHRLLECVANSPKRKG